MVDKNINYNKYFLRIIKEFDETTILNPNLNGQDTPKLNSEDLKIKNDKINEFCKDNGISENILFLAGTSLALNKFNFSDKNLIFHGNDIIFTGYLTHEEKNRLLFLRQKKMLDMFLERGAISQAQHDKSLHDLIEKMGMQTEVESNDD